MLQPAKPDSPSEILVAIDEICERFEDALRSGAAVSLEEHLEVSWSGAEREQLFEYLLRIDIDFRLGRGELVSPRDYLSRFPALAVSIAKVLPHELRADGPTEIGPYRITGKLGAGGMGTVYKAFQKRLNRFVAIKVLPAGALDDAAARRRFDRELESAGRVTHPNVVTAFDAGQAGETHYLVMELIEGFNLADLERRAGPLGIADACELIRQASLGLAQVHRQGLVHRDIKPANLMLGPDGQVKILDLGLALLHEQVVSDGELTNTGQMMGTFDYMAPEQCVDSHAVDGRADVYAIGATLFRLLTGRAPFAHRHCLTPVGRLSAKLQECPPSLREYRREIPAPLAALAERMLARDPAKRVESAVEVAKLLEPFCRSADLAKLFETAGQSPASASLSDTATQGPTIAGLVPKEEPESSPSGTWRWPWVALLVAGSVLAILAGVFFVPTKNGTLRVEINDPKITAQIAGEKITLRMGDGGKDISLSPGEKKMTVERDGFRFETDQIEIRSGNTVSLRVDLLEGKIVVRDGDKILGSEALPAPPKKVEPAPPALVKPSAPDPPLEPIPQVPPPVKGKMPGPNASEEEIAVYLRTLGADVGMKAVDPANSKERRITFLRWATGTYATDEQLAPCAQLRHIEILGYTGGNEGFKLFAKCAGMKNLELGSSDINADGAKILANFPKLEHLQIPCGDAKAFLREIQNHPSLHSIHFYRCWLAEDTLEELALMKKLRRLWLGGVNINGPGAERVLQQLSKLQQLEWLSVGWKDGLTEAEVNRLRAALPKCKVNE